MQYDDAGKFKQEDYQLRKTWSQCAILLHPFKIEKYRKIWSWINFELYSSFPKTSKREISRHDQPI
jgi:hypothetical protein